MHYGLAKIENYFYADNLHRAVHLAPCFVPNVPSLTHDYFNKTLMQFPAYGIYSINGPTWIRDLKTICETWPGLACAYFT